MNSEGDFSKTFFEEFVGKVLIKISSVISLERHQNRQSVVHVSDIDGFRCIKVDI